MVGHDMRILRRNQSSNGPSGDSVFLRHVTQQNEVCLPAGKGKLYHHKNCVYTLIIQQSQL